MTEKRVEYNVHDGMSDLEVFFIRRWHALVPGAPEPESEYRFCDRRWRLDFAWVEQRVAVECEGGIWIRGRHTRGTGFEKDCEKYNRATADGWRVFRCTAGMLKDNPAAFVEMVRNCIRGTAETKKES